MKLLMAALLCASLLGARFAGAASATRGAARVAVTDGVGTAPCMSETALRRAVEARLRRAVFRADLPVTLVVQVVFERTARGFSAELTMHDGSGQFLGQRAIVTEARHCSALDDSLALVVALLVDSPPSAPTVPEEPPSPPAAAQPDATSASPANGAPPTAKSSGTPPEPEPFTTLSVPRDTLAPREPWRFNVGLSAVVALGTIPGLASGAELSLGAQAPHLPELRLFADGFAGRDRQRSESAAGAHFNLGSLGLELCALDAELGLLHWFGCAGQSLGRLKVTSYGFDQNASRQHLTYALSVRTGLGVPLFGPLQARLGARAELPLSRAIFDYGSRDGSERELYQMQPITAALDLGLIVRL